MENVRGGESFGMGKQEGRKEGRANGGIQKQNDSHLKGGGGNTLVRQSHLLCKFAKKEKYVAH